MHRLLISIGLLLATLPGLAQQSASYKVEEHVFNAGGHPTAGVHPASSGFRLTMGSIGDGILAHELSGPSYGVDGGFTMAYPPPGETTGLLFTSKTDLTWDPEPSAGTYNLYRDLRSNLTELGFGQCEQQGLASTATTDSDPVPAGDGFFYLVTVSNRLAEAGTKGVSGGGSERVGSVCP